MFTLRMRTLLWIEISTWSWSISAAQPSWNPGSSSTLFVALWSTALLRSCLETGLSSFESCLSGSFWCIIACSVWVCTWMRERGGRRREWNGEGGEKRREWKEGGDEREWKLFYKCHMTPTTTQNDAHTCSTRLIPLSTPYTYMYMHVHTRSLSLHHHYIIKNCA